MNVSRYARHQSGVPPLLLLLIPSANSFPLRVSVVNSSAFSRFSRRVSADLGKERPCSANNPTARSLIESLQNPGFSMPAYHGQRRMIGMEGQAG